MADQPLALRWHYGPTPSDPDPGKMWCYACSGEVWYLEGGHICTECGATEEDENESP